MDISRIKAQVKLQIEAARDLDINAQIATALTMINQIGQERRGIVTVTAATGTITDAFSSYDPDPANRTEGQAFNYYPDLRCLILPSDLLSISDVYYNNADVIQTTLRHYNLDAMPNLSYCYAAGHELYTSFDLVDGEEIIINGRWAIRNIAILSDAWEEWLMNHILAGLYASKMYRDMDMFALYEGRRERAWRAARYRKASIGDYIARDGLLQ